jgi:hypothetical protein
VHLPRLPLSCDVKPGDLGSHQGQPLGILLDAIRAGLDQLTWAHDSFGGRVKDALAKAGKGVHQSISSRASSSSGRRSAVGSSKR